MDDKIVLKIMFLVLGVGIIAGVFLYYLIRKKKENNCTCKTLGKIISNIRREEHTGRRSNGDYRSYILWYSLCEYTVGEIKCVRQTNIGTSQPRKVGETVTVYYNPNNCHESYIKGDTNSGIKATIALIVGITSVILMYLMMTSIFL